MTPETENYRSFLKKALAERSKHRSIGACAQKLGIGRSFLSEVLSGKKNLSVKSALQISSRLELPPDDSEYFLLLVQLATHEDIQVREKVLARIREVRPEAGTRDLSIDFFKAISDWYHFAILELTLLKGFELTPRAAARKLGITIFEAEAAIERLKRLELLEMDAAGWKKTSHYVFVEAKTPSEAMANFHRQVLEKAAAAVSTQDRSERKGRTEIFPLDPKFLPEAEAILDRAAAELIALANKSKDATRIYAASLHVLNLTPERKST